MDKKSINPDIIEMSYNMHDTVIQQMVDLREEQVKTELILRGWTPPNYSKFDVNHFLMQETSSLNRKCIILEDNNNKLTEKLNKIEGVLNEK